MNKRIFFSLTAFVCLAVSVFATDIVTESFSEVIPIFKTPKFLGLVPCTVSRIVDGDTIIVDINESKTTVRLVGVDTPEKVHPSKSKEYYADEASTFTNNLLKGEQVYLLPDKLQGNKDRYGRMLAYVYRVPDGLFVNAEIIRQGYGRAYTKLPLDCLKEFEALEKFAKKSSKGLWNREIPEIEDNTSESTPTIIPPISLKKEAESKTTQIVFVTKTGTKYHRGSCGYLRKSKIPMELEKAKLAGYTPCSRCRPPQ